MEKKNNQPEEKKKQSEPTTEELKNYIAQLEEKVKKLENLAKVSNENYLQLQKEVELLRTRHREEIQNQKKYGIEKLAKELLEVVDNFERALKHMSQMEGCKEAYIGVEMIYKQLLKVLENHGVKPIEVDKFDHNLCEAVATVPTDQVEENTILEVVQKGYMLHDKVLRPAKVVVAVGKEEIT